MVSVILTPLLKLANNSFSTSGAQITFMLTIFFRSFMNDGLRTDIFLRYKPETIACACIYLAARTIENPIPLPKEPYPWYELYDASDRDVNTISEILMRLYQRNKPPSWQKLISTIDKLYMELFKPEQPPEPPKPERKEVANGDSRARRRRDESSPEERGRDRNRYKDRYRDEEPPRRRSRDRSSSRDRYRRSGLEDRNGKYRRDDRDRERSYSKLDRDERDRKKEKKEKDRKRDRSRSRDRKRDKVSFFVDLN